MMSNAALLSFVAAIFGGAVALAVAWQERRSPAHWAFVAGMGVLSVESLFVYSGLRALEPETGGGLEGFIQWETLKLMAGALVPGVWLFFSLTYARGNSREFVRRWRWVLGAAFLVPAGLVMWFRSGLVTAEQVGPDAKLRLGLTAGGGVAGCLAIAGLSFDSDESGADVPGFDGNDALADQVHDRGRGGIVFSAGLYVQPGAVVPSG